MNTHATWICPYCQSQHQHVQLGERCNQDGYWLIPYKTFQAHPEDPFLGRILADRYPMVDLLGSGGNSSVYKGIDLDTNQLVAVKIMSHLLDNSEVDHRARFFREARVLEGLNHPSIVRLLDFGEEEDGLLYMIQELVPGRSLEERIKAQGPVEPTLAARIMSDILSALSEPHGQGLIHRDLKPANVMIDERDGLFDIKLIDFGIAKPPNNTLDDIQTRTGLVLGTPMYMAPEQLQWEGVIGPFTDQYACGVIFYEMLSGGPPFFGSTAEIAAGHLKVPPPELSASLPEAMRRIVSQALAKKHGERFRDVLQMRAAIDAALGRALHPSAHGPGAHDDDELVPTTAIRIEDAPAYAGPPSPSGPIPSVEEEDYYDFADEPTRAMVDISEIRAQALDPHDQTPISLSGHERPPDFAPSHAAGPMPPPTHSHAPPPYSSAAPPPYPQERASFGGHDGRPSYPGHDGRPSYPGHEAPVEERATLGGREGADFRVPADLPRDALLRPRKRSLLPFALLLLALAGLTVTSVWLWRSRHNKPKHTETVIGAEPVTHKMITITEPLEAQRAREALKDCRCEEARAWAAKAPPLPEALQREIVGCRAKCEARPPAPVKARPTKAKPKPRRSRRQQ